MTVRPAELRALAGWVLVAITVTAGAVACGGDDQAIPPLPPELERFRDEPVQELTCAACHGPNGRAADTPLPDGLRSTPSDHPATSR